MTVCIDLIEERLSDDSYVYRVAVSDDETPPGEVVSFDTLSEMDAIKFADGLAGLIRNHTNYTVDYTGLDA